MIRPADGTRCVFLMTGREVWCLLPHPVPDRTSSLNNHKPCNTLAGQAEPVELHMIRCRHGGDLTQGDFPIPITARA